MCTLNDEALRAQLALHRLTSPALPVGAFSYSRGLEHAVERGWVHNEASALSWIEGILELGIGPLDGACFVRLYEALLAGDVQAVARLCDLLRAAREGAELQEEERNMGNALVRLLGALDDHPPALELLPADCGFVAAFALATARARVPKTQALAGLLFTVCEAQVSAAIRLIPLGQTAGQRIVSQLEASIARTTSDALTRPDADIGIALPGLAMASAGHETQYSRLFRS